MKSDSLFYKYFQTLPEALLLLAGENALPSSAEYRFQSVEIKDLSFRLDGVLALADFRDVFFFVEVQYQKDTRLYQRIFAEIMIFLHQHRPQGRWRVVVIFPRRSIDAGVPEDFREYLVSGRLKIVYLNELPTETISTFPLSLLQILTAKARKADVQSAVKHVMSSVIEKEKREDVLRLMRSMIAAKLPILSFEEVQAMVEPTMSMLEKTRYYRDIRAMEKKLEKLKRIEMEALKRGEQKGEKRGEKKGEKRGERRTQEKTALRLLAMGMELEKIAEATGLSVKAVKALRKS
jgi:predicted transposase/invertase (TIGR01784 family)